MKFWKVTLATTFLLASGGAQACPSSASVLSTFFNEPREAFGQEVVYAKVLVTVSDYYREGEAGSVTAGPSAASGEPFVVEVVEAYHGVKVGQILKVRVGNSSCDQDFPVKGDVYYIAGQIQDEIFSGSHLKYAEEVKPKGSLGGLFGSR